MCPFQRESLRGLAWGQAHRWVLGSGPGVAASVDYGDGAKDGDHPEDWRHSVEQCPQDYQDQAFGALDESDTAGADEAFGSARV